MKEIKVNPPYIKLEQFLKLIGEAETGGHAKIIIQNGETSVNGGICLARGKKLYNGDVVEIKEQECSYKVII